MTNDPVIDIQDVSFSYPGGPLVLEHVSLTVGKGEFIGLIGPNGGGKSTLVKIILGLLLPGKGKVRVFGSDPRVRRAAIGYVPQYVRFARDFPVSVLETVLLGRLGKNERIFGYSEKEKNLAWNVLRETGIADLAKRQLDKLSGGQFQRVLIARALACDPEILILDEPTANVDQRMEENIFDLLKRLNERITIVIVSHDIGFISQYVQRVACLNRHLICHDTAAVSGELIERLYGSPVHIIQHHHA